MTDLHKKIQKFEFEFRIFISFGLVILISALSFSVFAGLPGNAVALGGLVGVPASRSRALGYLAAALFMAGASFLRIWSGSVLTSRRMMSFKVKTDALLSSGPYKLVRNPIYLADLVAFTGFALCLPPIGLLLPVLLFLHYTQLIGYEEISLRKEFGRDYALYQSRVPRLLPGFGAFKRLGAALQEITVTRDGIRHDALYLLFIPGFILAAATGKLAWAVAVGLPAVVDWAIVHTKIGVVKDGTKPAVKTKMFKDVLYANCWEDPQLDRAALGIDKDDIVLSITSGGCNLLAFLLDDPRKVIALDVNPHQGYLLELKMAAFRMLSYRRNLEFFGVRPSSTRVACYRRRLRPCLSSDAARFWDGHPRKIARGIIHAGRYERYMRLLRKTVVAGFGKRRLIKRMFEADGPAAREKLYREKWQGVWWKFLTGVMLSRRLNALLFDKAFFAYLDRDFSFGRHFAAKAERALVRLPMKENYFLSYILLGRFYDEAFLPVYLRRENFSAIRDRLDRVEIVTDSCEDFFAKLEDSSISKFNFSNIFEWMSPAAFENLLRETVRVARDGAVLTYRNLLVFRERPPSLGGIIRSRQDLAKALQGTDLSFIYDNYVVEQVEKG
jgi:S-adenosylmethionine-diacylglycerol 3-amino-3-carboxypropyl transferase